MKLSFFSPKMPALDTSITTPVRRPSVASEFEAANQKFAASFNQSHLPSPPRR
jgi:carbonic anhydrase